MSTPDEELAEQIGRAVSSGTDAQGLARMGRDAARSVRGRKLRDMGRWLSELALEVAPRIPIRDLATIQAQHGGLSGAALAGELIRTASRGSAAVGAGAGALVGAEQLAPPTWVAIPLELIVSTLVTAAIEMKLVAELHEVYGRPVTGTPRERGTALLRAWAERRGITAARLATTGGLAEVMGHGVRSELTRAVRRRLLGRLGRNLSVLAPLMAGAVAGAEVNRRATMALGQAVVRDLAAELHGRPT